MRHPSNSESLELVTKVQEAKSPNDRLANERDLEALQGLWELVSHKCNGIEAHEGPCDYSFEGAVMKVMPTDRRPSYYTVKVDASKSPKEMDIIANWEDRAATWAEVIYEFDGDTFRWCYVNGKRPANFVSDVNPSGTLIVIRRVRFE